MLIRSFATEEEKRLTHDEIYTHATHANLVRDVPSTECRTQNGSAHGYVFPTLDFFLFCFNKVESNKSTATLFEVIILF